MASSVAWSADVVVLKGEQATSVERRAAELLVERLNEEGASVILGGNPSEARLAILLGTAERHALLKQQLDAARIPGPTVLDPGGEGYLLKAREMDGRPCIWAAGVDERGVLYAVGGLLRSLRKTDGSVDWPRDLDVRTAPAFKIRGLLAWQGATITQLTGARAWTLDEWKRNILNYVLAGANTFEAGSNLLDKQAEFDFFKSYGLEVLIHRPVNAGSGPKEWAATEAIGRPGYLCPSIPEARQALLDQADASWRSLPDYDYVRFVSGDGGGCECDRCRPYGAVYIKLVEDLAAIARKYHPKLQVFATNQKLDNAGDQAIFEALRRAEKPWLQAFCMGPGSNAMGWMPGRRQDHRMDLFDHPAFGPWSRYPQEVLRQLPPEVGLVMFTDCTHWVYSEFGLMDHELIPDRNHDLPPPWGGWLYRQKPDPALAMVYDRRTFHARPRSYYRAFQEMMPFAMGDVAYSEGHHDHLNQWMWQRLLWNPHRAVEDVVGEYAETFFGAEAAQGMAEAIFQLEQNLSAPLATNEGIDRFYAEVKEAGGRMPSAEFDRNYLWRQYMQKAALDKYLQLRLRAQLERQARAESRLKPALGGNGLTETLSEVQRALKEDIESTEMKRLREEAGRLGEESDRLYGVRSEGYFNLEKDFIGLGWFAEQVDRALAVQGSEQESLARAAVYYEDPGPGGFYDDPGAPGRAPHLTAGYAFGETNFDPSNRISQRNMAFTTDEAKGVTFEYRDLDPTAAYRVRVCLVRPGYLPRYASFQPQKTESIYADDVGLVKDLEVPLEKAEFFEFDIPRTATQDGLLRIWFQKSAGVGEGAPATVTIWRNTGGWGTLCSEIWLTKKQ